MDGDRPRQLQRDLREVSDLFLFDFLGLFVDSVLEIRPCDRLHLNHFVAAAYLKAAFLVIADNPADFPVEIHLLRRGVVFHEHHLSPYLQLKLRFGRI